MPSIITLYHSFRRRTLTMQLVLSIKHICEQFKYTPQEISTKYYNEKKQFTQQNTESKLSTLSRCIDINIQHQNTTSQLKTARFHITFEFEFTQLQDQYSYDHERFGSPCKGIWAWIVSKPYSKLCPDFSEQTQSCQFHKVL